MQFLSIVTHERVMKWLMVLLAYYSAGLLGLVMPAIGQHITLIWLPSGIAVAALLRWGSWLWSAVYLGALLVNVTIGSSLLLAAGIGVGNLIAPLMTALLLRRLQFHWQFDYKLDAVWLILAGMIGMTLSATGGVALLWLNGLLQTKVVASAWLAWWMGDTTGVLLVTPLLVAFSRNMETRYHRHRMEILIIGVLVVGLNWFVFLSPYHFTLSFIPVLLVMWAAMRFGVIGASIVVLINAVLSALGTALGKGPFHLNEEYNLLTLWIYIVTHTIVSLVITALQAENRRGEMETEEALQRLLEITATLAEGLYVINREGRITFTNPTASIMLGWSEAEMKGRLSHPLFHHSYRDGSPFKASECPLYNIMDNNCVVNLEEAWLWRRDGNCFPVSMIGSPIIRSGKVRGAVIAFRDISKQLEARQSLLLQETAMKAAANTIVITDVEGTIQWANPAFTSSTGYTLEEAIGQNPKILKSNHHDDSFYQHLWQTIVAGKVWQGVFVNKCKDDRLLHEEATITPVINEVGQIVNFIAVKRDVTKRLQVERELKEAKLKAEKASQAKSDFLATMSHEIRTPMNVVLGMSELLLETELNAEQRHFAQTMHQSGKGLLTVINDVLDFSRIEAGRIILSESPFSPRQVIEETAHLMHLSAKEKGVLLTVEVNADIPTTLLGDAGRIRQVLINLLGNAIKFTHQGTISLSLTSYDQDPKMLLFRVTDSGVGIAEEYFSQIFEQFTQADAGITRCYGGTGLGLTISQRLVTLMGGKIWVESQLGSGSTFFFTLPAKIVEHDLPLNKPEVSIPTTQTRNLRILLAEDQQLNQILFKAFIRHLPYHMVIVNDGAEAIKRVQNEFFDLVIMDVQMPIMNGYTATKEIRLWEKQMQRPPMLIIALSAHAMEGELDRSQEAGCDMYLSKPIGKQAFLNVLQRVANRSLKVTVPNSPNNFEV